MSEESSTLVSREADTKNIKELETEHAKKVRTENIEEVEREVMEEGIIDTDPTGSWTLDAEAGLEVQMLRSAMNI